MWKTRNNKIPEKPKSQKEQVSMLWDAVYNHMFSKLAAHDKMMGFTLAFLALILAFLGILILKG